MHRADHGAVAEVARRPQPGQRQQHRGGDAVGAVMPNPCAAAPLSGRGRRAPPRRTPPRAPGGQEIAAPGAAERGDRLPRQAELPGHGAQQPVDRRAVLRAAGEVDAAQQRPRLQPARAEDLAQELVARPRAARRSAAESRRSARRRCRSGSCCTRSSMRSFRRASSRSNSAPNAADRAALVASVVEREGHAPDLLALLACRDCRRTRRSRRQIGLGEQHVDRDAHAELVVQLADAPADRAGHAPAARPRSGRRGRTG